MLNSQETVPKSEIVENINQTIDDTMSTYLFPDEDMTEDVFDCWSKDEINQQISELSKKKRKEFLATMVGYKNIVSQFEIDIDRNLYNFISFCSDLLFKEKNIKDYVGGKGYMGSQLDMRVNQDDNND